MKPSPDKSRLLTAIRAARIGIENDDDGPTGLAATRRIYPGHNNREWIVRFTNRTDEFLTVLADGDLTGRSDDELADMVVAAWDNEWDDIRTDPAVGDFTKGSADFTQRNKQA